MPRLFLLVLLLPLVSGCGWASLLFGGHVSASSRTATLHLGPPTRASDVPRWVKVEHLPQKAVPGAKLFETTGCTACHTYAGTGLANLGAPDLTAIGRHHLGIQFQISHLKCPSCVNPGSPMPRFSLLGPTRLRELAIFLEASKGLH